MNSLLATSDKEGSMIIWQWFNNISSLSYPFPVIYFKSIFPLLTLVYILKTNFKFKFYFHTSLLIFKFLDDKKVELEKGEKDGFEKRMYDL